MLSNSGVIFSEKKMTGQVEWFLHIACAISPTVFPWKYEAV